MFLVHVLKKIVLTVASVFTLGLAPNPYTPTQSIYPLTLKDGRIICTAWSLDETQGIWVTAAHCVGLTDMADQPLDEYVNKSAVEVIKADEWRDVALLSVGFRAPAIPLQAYPIWSTPTGGEKVHVWGYMWGQPPTLFKGEVANLSIEAGGRLYTLYDMRCSGGHSGSPVLNEDGEALGVLQVGTGGFCGGSTNHTLEWLRTFLPRPSQDPNSP